MSGEIRGGPVALSAITQGAAGSTDGIARGDVLVRYADAALGDDPAALADARRALLEAVGPEAFVDAVAVVANFQRMVRIADATGIPLDDRLEWMTRDVRRELALERFGSSRNTPAIGPLQRALGAALQRIARLFLRAIGRRSR